MSATDLFDASPFKAQIAIWGHAIIGDTTEVGALIAEGAWWVEKMYPIWDRNQRYLDSIEVWDGPLKRATPYHYALPNVTNLLLHREGIVVRKRP